MDGSEEGIGCARIIDCPLDLLESFGLRNGPE